MRKIIILLMVMSLPLYADQTFTTESANEDTYYYYVPVNYEVTEHSTPTDFVVAKSYNNGNSWESITDTIGWGVINPKEEFEFLPTEQTNRGRLGIFWSGRGQNNFNNNPQDRTVRFKVKYGDIEFTDTPNFISVYDDVNLFFDADENTLPNTLRLDYRINNQNWQEIKDVSIDENNWSFFNSFITDTTVEVSFRVTYTEGSGVGYTLAEVNNIPVSEYNAEIVDKPTLENFKFDNNDPVKFTVRYDNFNNFRNTIIVKVYEPIANTWITLGDFWENDGETEFEHSFNNEFEGVKIIRLYTQWGEVLDEMTITLYDKWLRVRTISDYYETFSPVKLEWSASEDFDKVKIEKSNNNGSTWENLEDEWSSVQYPYELSFSEEQTIQFRVSAHDGYTESYDITNVTIIGESCPSDSLETIIDSLEIVISEFVPDTLFVTLIKDYVTNIDEYVTINTNEIDVLNSIGGLVKISGLNVNEQTFVYFVDLNGQIVMEENIGYRENINLNTSNLINGVYILYIVNESGFQIAYKIII